MHHNDTFALHTSYGISNYSHTSGIGQNLDNDIYRDTQISRILVHLIEYSLKSMDILEISRTRN